MHEMALVEDIIAVIREYTKRHPGSNIKAVNIAIGELEHVSAEHFYFHFKEGVRGTSLDGINLTFRKVRPRFKCKACGREFSAVTDTPGCPFCGTKVVDLLAGSGIHVESIEVEDKDK